MGGNKRVLYISGSIGLGHVTRDLAIARSLRKRNPKVEIEWLSEDPATSFLRSEGERILEGSSKMNHGNRLLPDPDKYDINIMRWLASLRKQMSENAKIILDIVKNGNYDLVVGDEAFDLTFEFWADPSKKTFPFVMMYDCFGADQMNHNPKDMFFTWYINRLWGKFIEPGGKVADRFLFVGELEDIEDRSLGIFLPNRRKVAEKGLTFVGNIIRFDPRDYTDKNELRNRLGYGNDPLVIVTKGGTAAGRGLFKLCIKAHAIARKSIPNLKMVIICGPSIPPEEMESSDGIEIRGFEPRLYEHIAAADLIITQAGHTTVNETVALGKPFIYFPLENHFDQLETAAKLNRLGLGQEMHFYNTSPEVLAEGMVSNIGKRSDSSVMKFNDGNIAADIIDGMLGR